MNKNDKNKGGNVISLAEWVCKKAGNKTTQGHKILLPGRKITIDFTPETFTRLEEMRGQLNLEKSGTVITTALMLLDFVCENTQDGFVLYLEKDGTYTKVIWPIDQH